MQQYSSIIVFVVIIVAFYFLLIRPENKRKKQVTEMRNELAVGDEITTIGGIVGVICNIKDDVITIETGADRVRISLMRWAISSRGPVDAPAPAAKQEESSSEKKPSLFGRKKKDKED